MTDFKFDAALLSQIAADLTRLADAAETIAAYLAPAVTSGEVDVVLPSLNLAPQPDANGWIEWRGATDLYDQPVPDDTNVDYRFRGATPGGGREFFGKSAGSLFWNHDGKHDDIVAYRISKDQPA